MRYGIIGAMPVEIEKIKQNMTIEKETVLHEIHFYEGSYEGRQIVLVTCGVGKVNAALCVQILTDKFAVTHIINTGVAGSLNAALDIGDILVSRDAMHHDVDATIFGYRPGEVPQLGICEFVADDQLASLAIASCREVNPDLQVHLGRVVSGDQFISSSKVKERLIQVFHGDCAEMEGASIAQSAYLNHIPFVIIRAISDKADGSAEVDYPVFEEAAARHSARLVADLVKRI